MMRTMQTAFHSLYGHPNFSEINFIIHPLIRAYICDATDISNNTLENLKNNFERSFYGSKISIASNWSLNCRSVSQLYQSHFCVHNKQYPELKCLESKDSKSCTCHESHEFCKFQTALKRIFNDPSNYYLHLLKMNSVYQNLSDAADFNLDLAQAINKDENLDLMEFLKLRLETTQDEPIESLVNFRHRMFYFKEYLKSDIIPKLKQDEVVLVVGHSKTGKFLSKPEENGFRAKRRNCVVSRLFEEDLLDNPLNELKLERS